MLLRVKDRALFTATELALIQSSVPSQIKSLSMARLKSQIARARRYWDKYRDLARRQHRAKKRDSGRGKARPFSNVRTGRKAQVLAEVLSRFRKRLDQVAQQDRLRNRRRPKPARSGISHKAT